MMKDAREGDQAGADDFYDKHRGGTGNVIACFIYDDDLEIDVMGVFGSIEAAQQWADTFDEECTAVFAPFVVDAPEYGNVPKEQRQ